MGSYLIKYGGSFTKVCENADGSLLKAPRMFFAGDDIVQHSKKYDCSVLFAVSAHDTDDTLLGGASLYDVTQEKLYTKRKWEWVSLFPLCCLSIRESSYHPYCLTIIVIFHVRVEHFYAVCGNLLDLTKFSTVSVNCINYRH